MCYIKSLLHKSKWFVLLFFHQNRYKNVKVWLTNPQLSFSKIPYMIHRFIHNIILNYKFIILINS